VWTPALKVPAVRAFLLDGSGESYSERRIATVVELAASRLQLAGETVPERPTEPVVAFRNGIVRLDERPQLRPFAGQPATRIRFPIEWDDDMLCPVYDEWIAEQTAGENDPRLVAEILGQVFDTFRSPERHALLYGPSRSGKSTLIRLAQAMISPEHRSYVSLHDMSNDRFATSDLVGSRLNAAADLSAASVRDLAEFKKVTGDDVVRVQAKYQKARWLHPTAVHLFSANSIPAIGEDSRAYLNRVVPISFPKTFEGREDPALERAMLAELPAIAGRWLDAHSVRVRDGVWTETDPETQAEFELASDPVRQFLDDETIPDGWTNRAKVYGAYRDWAGVNGLNPKAAARFYASCHSAGIPARRLASDRQLQIRLRADTR
jgi:putative DNA primase/helicase